MKQFTVKQQRWLKGFHLLSVSIWLTCGIVMLSFSHIASEINSGDQLYMLNYLTDFIDMKILVPAAIFTLLTGLLYSVYTKWGFFKHRWLLFKWVVTVAIIITGTIFTGPWIEEMANMAKRDGIAVLHNSHYIMINRSQFIIGLCMNITLIFTLFISVFKPWKGR